MKKLLFSLVILVIVITSGILSIGYFKSSSDEIVTNIDKASDAVKTSNWKNASSSMKRIDDKWNMTEKSWSLLTDHIEVDNIEMSMKKTGEYIDSMDTAQSLAELESLRFMVEHIYEKEQFNLKNIF